MPLRGWAKPLRDPAREWCGLCEDCLATHLENLYDDMKIYLRDRSVPQEPTQSDVTYERLRADILSCRLRPWAKIRINEVAKTHGVSLGAVREALSRLASENMAIATAQKGYRVAGVSAADLVDLTDTRIQIEGICIRQSIASGDIEWETALVAAFHRLQRLPEREPADPDRLSDAWSQAHNVFHESVVAASPSSWMLKLREMLYAQSERYRRLSLPLRRIARDVGAEHKGIYEAVMARDAELAVERMVQHLSLTTKILLSNIEFDQNVEEPHPKDSVGRRRRLA